MLFVPGCKTRLVSEIDHHESRDPIYQWFRFLHKCYLRVSVPLNMGTDVQVKKINLGVSVMITIPVSSHIRYPPELQEKYKQGYENFQRLARALNSDDLAGAQKAFATFKLNIQNIQQAQNARHISQLLQSSEQIDGTQQANTSKGTYIDVMA
jgi:hypothetical protein